MLFSPPLPAPTQVVSGSFDGTLRVWDPDPQNTDTLDSLHELKRHTADVVTRVMLYLCVHWVRHTQQMTHAALSYVHAHIHTYMYTAYVHTGTGQALREICANIHPCTHAYAHIRTYVKYASLLNHTYIHTCARMPGVHIGARRWARCEWLCRLVCVYMSVYICIAVSDVSIYRHTHAFSIYMYTHAHTVWCLKA